MTRTRSVSDTVTTSPNASADVDAVAGTALGVTVTCAECPGASVPLVVESWNGDAAPFPSDADHDAVCRVGLTTVSVCDDAVAVAVRATLVGATALTVTLTEADVQSRLDAQLDKVRWKRFAAGLHAPLGLKIINGIIHVAGRDQVASACSHRGAEGRRCGH